MAVMKGVTVKADSPFKTFKDMIEFARAAGLPIER